MRRSGHSRSRHRQWSGMEQPGRGSLGKFRTRMGLAWVSLAAWQHFAVDATVTALYDLPEALGVLRRRRRARRSSMRIRVGTWCLLPIILGPRGFTMSAILEPVRTVTIAEMREARHRIAGTIVRTPVVRLDLGKEFPDIRLKLENLQPTNSYKLRGAVNAVALLSEAERKRGVWTISAGNAGQGIAYAAREADVPCTVVAIESAPEAKRERMRALGAKLILVPYGVAWKALGERRFDVVEGTFVHPFDDHNFIVGHSTMGFEILEDVPDATAVIASIGGGGLIAGVGSALKALKPDIKVWGAEPETAAPAARSFAAGSPQVFEGWQASVVDGAGGESLFPRMWERIRPLVEGSIVVSLEQARAAMRLLALNTRVIAEGAGALPLAAAITGAAGRGPVVAIVSGGNVDLAKFFGLVG